MQSDAGIKKNAARKLLINEERENVQTSIISKKQIDARENFKMNQRRE